MVVGAERIPWEAPVSLQTSGQQEGELLQIGLLLLNELEGSIDVGIECTTDVKGCFWRGRRQPFKVPHGLNDE